MTKNAFGTPRSHAHLQRNAFDLSRRDVYSCKAGELVPCFVQEVNPNEHFEIRPDIFLRTQTLNTAAYARMKQKIEFFFVPYRCLWFKADQFFTGTNYSTSSVYEDAAPLLMPRVPFMPKGRTFQFTTALLPKIFNFTKADETELADIFGNNPRASYVKLLDMLGYGHYIEDDFIPGTVGTGEVAEYVNPFRMLAYQKIYQDFYRNPLYEPYDNGCNIDDLQKAQPNGIVWPMDNASLNRLLTPRYASWKKDYFTNLRAQNTLYMSLWMQNDNVVPASSYENDNLKLFGNLYNSNGSYFQALSNVGARLGAPLNGDGKSTPISAMDVRSLFALEKLLDNMARAKDGSYNSQIEARFGVKPLVDPHLQSKYLGGVDSPVVIGEVVSNSSSTATIDGASVSSVLGQIAGKGTSSQSKGFIEFDSTEHGIIMGIFSIVPECDYNATGIEPFNQKFKRVDYFTPEFDKLGFAPVCLKEMFAYGNSAASSANLNTDHNNLVLGYNPMYTEYKTSVDKIHGDFISDGSLSAWTAPRYLIEVASMWNSSSSGLSASFFHVNPNVLDSIFAVRSSEADQFLVNQYLDVKAVRPMSVNGLPYCN